MRDRASHHTQAYMDLCLNLCLSACAHPSVWERERTHTHLAHRKFLIIN